MSAEQKAEMAQVVRAEIGTRSPDGRYAVVRYFAANGRMFRRTRRWADAVRDVLHTPPGSSSPHNQTGAHPQ